MARKKATKTTPNKRSVDLEKEIRTLKNKVRSLEEQLELASDLEKRANEENQELNSYCELSFVLSQIILEDYTIPEFLEKFGEVYKEFYQGDSEFNANVYRAFSDSLRESVENFLTNGEPIEDSEESAETVLVPFLSAMGLAGLENEGD